MLRWKSSLRMLRLLHYNSRFRPAKPRALPRQFQPTDRVRSKYRDDRRINRRKTMIIEAALLALAFGFMPLSGAVVAYWISPTPYRKLRSGFRVLVLERGEDVDSQPLVCRLDHVSSLDGCEYEALSYAWGEKDWFTKVEIICNGHGLMIQANLAAALRKHRFPERERVIWVDAICINQDDPYEKATQVLKMREIYANARQVIVWLGQEDESAREALDFLTWLSVYIEQEEEDDLRKRQQWAKVKIESQEKFEHVAAFLKRPWFTRTWVVQEVASAQNAVLMCGSKTMSWESFWTAESKLWDPLFTPFSLEAREGIVRSQRNIWAVENAKRSVNGMAELSLHEILLGTCSNDCSDPRDKVFAVLGLATDWLEKGGLSPDYRATVSAEEVFKRFAIWDVKKNGTLRILSSAAVRDEFCDLPSWAPDWRRIVTENARPFTYSKTKISASKGKEPDAWFSDHGRVLNAMGHIVDSIKAKGPRCRFRKVSEMFPLIEASIREARNSQTWLQECLEFAAGHVGDLTEQRYGECWRTLICGLTGDGFAAPPERGLYLKNYLKFLKSDVLDFISAAEREIVDNWQASALRLVDIHPDAKIHALIESDLVAWASGRMLCATEKGRLASAPLTAQEGDLICILDGGEVPYILRPQDRGEFVVVGECYVDGIMYGEALANGNLREKQFKLV